MDRFFRVIEAVAFVPNSPTLIGNLGIDHSKTVTALQSIGESLADKIDAVVVMTPHFQTFGSFQLVSSNKLKQIYDFYGFPKEFYNVRYEPPGDPDLAGQIVSLAENAEIPISQTTDWGLDHGAWSPLFHIFRGSNVPVVPVSISPDLGKGAHRSLGAMMRSSSISKRLLLISSGSLIHRLDLFQAGSKSLPPEAGEYLNLCLTSFQRGSWDAIRNAPKEFFNAAAPEGYNLPLNFIEGAVGERFRATVMSNEMEFNVASMTTVVFNSL